MVISLSDRYVTELQWNLIAFLMLLSLFWLRQTELVRDKQRDSIIKTIILFDEEKNEGWVDEHSSLTIKGYLGALHSSVSLVCHLGEFIST